MPINNLAQQQLSATAADAIIKHLNEVLNSLNPLGRNLTAEERQQYGSINERQKLLVNKANDFHNNQPGLQSPDVDWKAFDESLLTRTKLEAIEALCSAIAEVSSDTRILHDYDLYQNTLVDYDYTKYKAISTVAAGGYTNKYEELKQFFPNPTGTRATDAAGGASAADTQETA